MKEKEFFLTDMKELVEQIYGTAAKEAIEKQYALLAKIRKERDRKTIQRLLDGERLEEGEEQNEA
jgi:hypothetical protein